MTTMIKTQTPATPETQPRTTTWSIDPGHSAVGFAVRHMVVSKVRGRFTRWDGTIVVDERAPERSWKSGSPRSLDRRDFGLQWNQLLEAGGVLVGEKVEVEIEVEAVREAAPAQA